MNTVIHLVLRLIIGPKHGLGHISSGMTLDFPYIGIKRPLSNCPCRNQTGISICLTIGVTILASITEIQLALYSRCTVSAPVWITGASVYLHITLVFLTALYMHLISPSVESYDISG